MKNNFLSKAYGGVMEARHKFNGLGLPRQWKVITSTLLLLFTFAIGNAWGDQTINLYYGTSKAVDGNNLNTEDFFFSGHTSNTGKSAVEIGGTSFTHYLTMSGYGASAINSDPAKLILYYPKKSTTTFTVYVQNKYNGNKKYYIDHLFEGETVVSDRKYQKQLAKDGTEKHEYTFTNTDKKNAVIALMPSQTMYIYQITVTESGDDLKQAGDNGYSFNTYRAGALAEAEVSVDGLNIKPSSKLNVGSSYFKIKQSSTYAKFVLSQKTLVTVGVSNSRKFIFCAAATPTDAEKADKKGTGSAGNVATALTAGTWYLESESTSELQISNISFSIPTITYNKNDVGASGTMSSNTWTVAANGFTAPSGKKFDKWNTQADGEGDDVTVGTEVDANTNLFAIWKDDVAEYTVTYKDGETTLKSVNVAVGSAPDAYNPTKDFYSFAAWQKDAIDYDPADLASDASANDEITLTARWTAQYTSGTYEFTGHLTMGTAPNQMTIANSSDGSSYDAGRIDNIYVSAQKIGYQNDGGDYDGWKLKTTNGTLRFLVENACGVRVTLGEANPLRIAYTEGGVAKTADIAKSTTSSVYKADANTLVTLTNITSGNKTVTLKKIEILPLYNATYTDGKGDASGSASNVTEVTLPTPSATTVGSYSFTGWVANQTVYDGETPKTTGEALNAGGTYTLTATTTFTAQWALIADFDVKFFQGYGDPDVQIGTTQSISTGGYAVAPTDPVRDGYRFLGWSTDGTEANIVTVASYVISVATDFTAVWIQQFEVTFDGAGAVSVDNGATVASPDSPTQTGKIFQGWYNGESKYDFSAAVTGNLALESKWAVANPNHYVYAYNDDFHFDGVVYKTPDGKTKDPEAAEASNVALATNPYTLFSGAAGITSIVATNGIYDYKKAAGTKHITAYLKLKADDATSNVVFTIASGYTAELKLKMNGYSSNATISLKKGDDAVTPSGTQEGTAEGKNYGELTYSLTAGAYTLTTTNKTLYISNIDLVATALPTHSVTYKPGDGEGAWVVDADATEVADCPGTFTAPTGKVFNGWKNESDDSDVAVGAIVEDDMNLIAQWINVYAVTFNMNGHGDAIDPQNVKAGAKAAKPADPSESGWDFGGWFTDNGTFEAPFDFNTPITATTPLYAKWTADPCPDKKSIVKAVMATNTTATVTGYNSNEYAGGYIVNNLADDASNTNMYDFGEGEVKGFKLKGSNSAIFATLSKGGFVAGDQVVFAVTKNAGDNKLAIYAAKDKDNVLKLVELDVDAAGIYTYRLTQDNIDAIEAAGSDYLSIGTFRGDYNPYIYSVELKGCRSWAIFHTLTFKNIDGTATIAAESLEEGTYASTVAPAAPKITLKRFLGWSESIGGSTVDLTTYTITEDKTLYAVYEDIVCPTTGTVYKFEIKDELPSENLPTSTDKDMSSYITATGDGYLTYTATANNKATINSDGTIQMKDASAAYLKVELECALAAGDQIRAHITGNPMRVQVAATYDSGKDLILAKNAYEFVAITSAMEGKQVLYITRSSNGNANLADFEIYRPAKYDVSFNMMGHGSAISDLEDVVEGSKIAAPSPAPTDADYSFAGWYKENTLENEWDFDGDVVETNTTLYAKWLDKSDATLKSLKYGETDIVLVVDQYTYDITLPSLTSSVPALTAETNSPNATKVIVDGTFDGAGNATSTVTVTPEVGADKVYTVNFARGIALEQVTVTTSMEWDWSAAGVTAEINNTNTPGLSGNDVVIANVPGVNNDADFNSQALKASGTNAIRTTYFQGKELNIKTDKEGMLIVDFSGTNNKARVLKVYDNADTEIAAWSYNSDARQVQQVVVPAGKVTLKAFEGESGNNARIYNLKFYAYDTERADSWIAPGELGTICYPNGHIITGAEVYEMAGVDENNKFVFDQVEKTEPGKPYLFVATSNEPIKLYKTTAAAEVSPIANNGMIGTFVSIDLDYTDERAAKWYYFSGKKFYAVSKRTDNLNVPANRAYVDLNESHPAGAPKHGVRRITFDVQGANVATGVENAAATDKPAKMLINGQLFILRGEKMYDAKGQLVK